MDTDALLAIVERLCAVELDTLDRDELADVVTASSHVRGWLDALDLRCARQGRSLADAGRAEPATALIAAHSNRSSRDADQITRRDTVAAAMPTFEDGLTDGAVSAGHLDAIAGATRNASPEVRAAFAGHEDELLAFAGGDSIDTFARRCRSLVAQLTAELTGNDATELDRQRAASHVRRWVDRDDGLHHTHAALDPLRDEIMWTAINRALRKLQQVDGNARTPWNQMQVDALVTAVQGGVAPQPSQSRDVVGPDVAPSPVDDIAHDLATAVDRAISRAGDGTGHGPATRTATRSATTTATGAATTTCTATTTGTSEATSTSTVDGDSPPPTDRSTPDDASDSAAGIEAEIRHSINGSPRSACSSTSPPSPTGSTNTGSAKPKTARPSRCPRSADCAATPRSSRSSSEPTASPSTWAARARTANRAQRRALRSMHRTCAHPGCTVPFSQTKAHHIRWWRRDRGPTDIDNLIPLCEKHHHLVHEGGWSLSMTPDRVATWTRPDGTVHWTGSTIDRTADQSGSDPPVV